MALLSALIWAVHPLNTEAVVYVTQRTELLMALFYLATLYASLRYWTSAAGTRRPAWGVCAGLACALGMTCKEVMVSAPVMVLLFERIFLTSSFVRSIRNSWPLYIAVSIPWLLLFVLHHGGPRSETVGFHLGVAAPVWWATQCKALLLYLKLCFWPWPLSVHYELTYLDTPAAALPWVLPVVALGALTAFLVWRRTAAGFVLVWTFAILSPTLIVPIVTEIAVERRMYLPLAAIVPLVVGCGYRVATLSAPRAFRPNRRRSTVSRPVGMTLGAGALLAMILAAVSIRRLEAYTDTVTIWQDALENYPDSDVINANLASELLAAGRPDEALAASRQAIERGCDSRGIHNNLGAALTAVGDRNGFQPGQLDEAIAELREALRTSPDFEDALVNLSFALLKAGHPEESLGYCTRALTINPRNPQALYAQGTILTALGKPEAAVESFQQALEYDPRSAASHYGLALVLLGGPHQDQAIEHLRTALSIDPALPEVHYALGGALAAGGDWHSAAREYAAAAGLRPSYALAINNLGVMQMKLGETDNAIRNFGEAARLQPSYAEAQNNLSRAIEAKRQGDVGEKQ